MEARDDNSDMYPQLVAQFTCQYEANRDCNGLQLYQYLCCSVVRMVNVTHAAIVGVSVTVYVRTAHVSGVILQQCSHLHIQSISIEEVNNDFVSDEYQFGILAYGFTRS